MVSILLGHGNANMESETIFPAIRLTLNPDEAATVALAMREHGRVWAGQSGLTVALHVKRCEAIASALEDAIERLGV